MNSCTVVPFGLFSHFCTLLDGSTTSWSKKPLSPDSHMSVTYERTCFSSAFQQATSIVHALVLVSFDGMVVPNNFMHQH